MLDKMLPDDIGLGCHAGRGIGQRCHGLCVRCLENEMKMKHTMLMCLVTAATLFMAASIPGDAKAQTEFSPDRLASIEAAIAKLAEGKVGRIGLAARDVDGGTTILLNGDELFPLASTI